MGRARNFLCVHAIIIISARMANTVIEMTIDELSSVLLLCTISLGLYWGAGGDCHIHIRRTGYFDTLHQLFS